MQSEIFMPSLSRQEKSFTHARWHGNFNWKTVFCIRLRMSYKKDGSLVILVQHRDRNFVLKVSALEIYNEVVKDMLNMDSGPLRLLDDPEVCKGNHFLK